MDINGRATHIEDYLVSLHTGQWFGWSDSKNKVYANLIIHDDSKTKPTEQECIDGLAQLQTDYNTAQTNTETKKASGKQKLKDLGLDDAEINALIGAYMAITRLGGANAITGTLPTSVATSGTTG